MTKAHCIICKQEMPSSKLTAGSLYADGKQAFACIDHAWNRAKWLLAWAKFAVAQNQGRATKSLAQADKPLWQSTSSRSAI